MKCMNDSEYYVFNDIKILQIEENKNSKNIKLFKCIFCSAELQFSNINYRVNQM